MIDGHTTRTHFYVSMQQTGIVCAVNVLPNDTLEVQGQRLRSQPDTFWSYYPGDVGILCKVCVCAKFLQWKYPIIMYFGINTFCSLFLFREQLVGIHNTLE